MIFTGCSAAIASLSEQKLCSLGGRLLLGVFGHQGRCASANVPLHRPNLLDRSGGAQLLLAVSDPTRSGCGRGPTPFPHTPQSIPGLQRIVAHHSDQLVAWPQSGSSRSCWGLKGKLLSSTGTKAGHEGKKVGLQPPRRKPSGLGSRTVPLGKAAEADGHTGSATIKQQPVAGVQ